MTPSNLFPGLRPPHPPSDLRARSLERAARTLSDPVPHWIDRLWNSRRLRWSWALTVALLAAANGWLWPAASPTDRTGRASRIVEQSRRIERLLAAVDGRSEHRLSRSG